MILAQQQQFCLLILNCVLCFQLVEAMEPAKMQSLLFIKVLGLKPGWKDSNFQVMKAKFGFVSLLVSTSSVFGKRSTACVLPVIVDKLADVKVTALLE